MRKRLLIYMLICAVAAASCSEEIDVKLKDADRTYLVLEGFLTDLAFQPQSFTLTESKGYFDKEEVPPVCGAVVSVDDGSGPVYYRESSPGVYTAPFGFHGKPGNSYHLSIDATVAGEERHYEADATMPQPGFKVEAIDYAYTGIMEADSIWTISMWGEDNPGDGFYHASVAVNGNSYPYDLSLILDDKYFAGQKITAFPVAVLEQTAHNQEVYGPCCKFLEKGDIITFMALTLPKGCFEFFFSFANNMTSSAIPFFSSQPANCPTNLTGGDAMGWFAACPVSMASVIVDDPMRPDYKRK